MNTIIPIIIPPKVFGLGMIIFIIWFIGLILLLNKAFDEHGSDKGMKLIALFKRELDIAKIKHSMYGFWWLLPLGYLLLPFILLVLFG